MKFQILSFILVFNHILGIEEKQGGGGGGGGAPISVEIFPSEEDKDYLDEMQRVYGVDDNMGLGDLNTVMQNVLRHQNHAFMPMYPYQATSSYYSTPATMGNPYSVFNSGGGGKKVFTPRFKEIENANVTNATMDIFKSKEAFKTEYIAKKLNESLAELTKLTQEALKLFKNNSTALNAVNLTIESFKNV